ncbi:MAG: T9SS type A sorting domain-containing protein [Bizionia sp.]|nr:T9SS type A sorting domain-containing protein [Bizionia sp.]
MLSVCYYKSTFLYLYSEISIFKYYIQPKKPITILTVMKHLLFFLCFTALTVSSYSQTTKKVLFLGNSYTAANNLPVLVQNMATSTGDILIYDSNTPGGYRFLNHVSNTTTLNKINAEDWDYVALQAQSQETSFPQSQMEAELFPHATTLSNTIRANNECSQPLFYMTWGRENGDANNCPYLPWVCTYEAMDDVIASTYTFMANTNNAELAPVGAVWRYIRTNHPTINLYSSDGSHPSLAGSYAAACVFYTMVYKKDPTLMPWNSTLSTAEANSIKLATQTVVFNALTNWDFTLPPAIASFTETITDGNVAFSNTSDDADAVFWDFGDNTTSTQMNPTHTYTESGIYTVTLTVTKCGKENTITKEFNIDTTLSTSSFQVESFSVFPNPASHFITLAGNTTYNTLRLQLIDMSGKLILENEWKAVHSVKIDISNMQNGIYFLNIIADTMRQSEKVIKK